MKTHSSDARLHVAAAIAITFGLQVSALHGQENKTWGQKMFEVTEIDFGTVPKESNPSVLVKVKNVYKESIHIIDLTQSSGVFSWTERPDSTAPIVIPSGKQVSLTLRANAIQFTGEKESQIKVALLEPVGNLVDYVVLQPRIKIRPDIIIKSGNTSFGVVDLGERAERKIVLEYTGANAWQFTKLTSKNPHLDVTWREESREAGKVAYELTVALKIDAPEGPFCDQITLQTNEANNPEISLSVEGKIERDIFVTDVKFIEINPGQTDTAKLAIRGVKAIQIVGISRAKNENSKLQDDAFKFKFDNSLRTDHTVLMSFTAPDAPGEFDEMFLLKVRNRSEPIPFHARGKIVSPK